MKFFFRSIGIAFVRFLILLLLWFVLPTMVGFLPSIVGTMVAYVVYALLTYFVARWVLAKRRGTVVQILWTYLVFIFLEIGIPLFLNMYNGGTADGFVWNRSTVILLGVYALAVGVAGWEAKDQAARAGRPEGLEV